MVPISLSTSTPRIETGTWQSMHEFVDALILEVQKMSDYSFRQIVPDSPEEWSIKPYDIMFETQSSSPFAGMLSIALLGPCRKYSTEMATQGDIESLNTGRLLRVENRVARLFPIKAKFTMEIDAGVLALSENVPDFAISKASLMCSLMMGKWISRNAKELNKPAASKKGFTYDGPDSKPVSSYTARLGGDAEEPHVPDSGGSNL